MQPPLTMCIDAKQVRRFGTWLALSVVSGTLAWVLWSKPENPDERARFLLRWNNIYCLPISFCVATALAVLSVTNIYVPSYPALVAVLLGILAIWRSDELFIGLLCDALDRLNHKPPKSAFTPTQRILRTMLGYLEVIILFGILYSTFPEGSFEKSSCNLSPFSIVDALYFSATTITTVGYGDIKPVRWFSRLAAVYEVLGGLLLLVLALGTYLSLAQRPASLSCAQREDH
jgi:hypothetical protein